MRLARFDLSVVIFLAVTPWCVAQTSQLEAKNGKRPPAVTATHDHGRVEQHGDLRIVRLYGSPEERGFAHGELLGKEIADLCRAELGYRFGRQPRMLGEVRRMLPRLIAYPDDVQAELEALYRGILASGAKLAMKDFDRDMDLQDLLLVNALDVFALMGCSGFTAWEDMVEGGGVLTTRNFDWPVSGAHLMKATVLLVQYPTDGHAFAAVTWPGYIGMVTGVNADGCAAFLHVGSGEGGMPEPDSMPTAIAAREILQRGDIDGMRELGRRMLEETSPPSSFITRIVMPRKPEGSDTPVAVYETDIRKVVLKDREAPCVVTNHFAAHGGGDSGQRFAQITEGVGACLENGDKKLSVAEAWDALRAVDRSGRGFATLHSLVFRADPWVFELRIGVPDDDDRIVAAPRATRRYSFARDVVFAPVP